MVDAASFMPNLGILMWTAIIGFAVMFIFLFFFVFRQKGNMLIDLFEERANGDVVLVLSDAGCKIIKRKGEIEKWQILNTKIEPFEPKQRDRLIPHLNKRIDKAYLLRDKNGNIHVIKFDIDEKTKDVVMQPDYRDPMNFVVTEYDERAKVKEQQAAWKEFQPMLIGILCLVMVVCTTVLIFDNANKQASRIQSEVSSGIDKIDGHVAQYDEVIRKAAIIVTNQEVLDRTNNWTTTHIPAGG